MPCVVTDTGRKEPIASPLNLTTPNGSASAEAGRRRRRTREDVTERICDAARQLFAERGFHGATTREIARVADVSETLLFRYYGNKAALFDEVVTQPFNQVLQLLIDGRSPGGQEHTEHHVFGAVYDLFAQNQQLFTALLSARGGAGEEGGAPSFVGLIPFFDTATREQEQRLAASGHTLPFDLNLGTRLTFGMMAASVLLRDWLFPEGAPPREEIVRVLEMLVTRGLGTPAVDRAD